MEEKPRTQDGRHGSDAMNSRVTEWFDKEDPGMISVNTPLNGENYIFWRHMMKLTLRAMGKVEFIDAESEVPGKDSPEYKQWKQRDCLVRCWILNSILGWFPSYERFNQLGKVYQAVLLSPSQHSMTEKMKTAFIYYSSARKLWEQLEILYGGFNGYKVYQLHREINSISQGNRSGTEYFSKLSRLWFELRSRMPTPTCDCGAATSVSETAIDRLQIDRLMQFLRGLNDTFHHVRDLILYMDPLPSVQKAFSWVIGVENLRKVFPRPPKN